MKKNDLTDAEYENIKRMLDRFSYIDLVNWRNEMIACGEVHNRLFSLFSGEILRRAAQFDSVSKKSSK